MPLVVVGPLDLNDGEPPVLRLTPQAELVLAKFSEGLPKPFQLLLQGLIGMLQRQCDEAQITSFGASKYLNRSLDSLVGDPPAARWAEAILASGNFGAQLTIAAG